MQLVVAERSAAALVRRCLEAERLEDSFPKQCGRRPPGDPLEDLREHEVVRVRVRGAASGRELEWEPGGRRDEPPRRDHDSWVARDGTAPRLELHVVGDAARVVEQIPEADASSFAKTSREERADTVVQPEPVLGDELHDDRRNEALRDASDPEPVVGASLPAADLGVARGDDGALAVLLDECDHGGDVARCDELVGGPLELALRSATALRTRSDACDAESCDQPHVPIYAASRPSVTALSVQASLGVYERHRWPPTSRSSSHCRSLRVNASPSSSRGRSRAITRRMRSSFGRTSASHTASQPRSPDGVRTPRRRCRTGS